MRRHQQGIPLTRIAAELAIPYGTVRNIWRLFRRHGLERLAPDHGRLGRPVAASTIELLRIACELKRDHPTWGAGLIRLELRTYAQDGRIPSVRSLQLAFVRAGVHRPRRRRAAIAVVPQAALPHEVWQVNAVENVPLATGERICWLTATDEASGALLAADVSPHGRWERVPAEEIREMFRRAFARWGLPDRVRVDNGYPWGTPRDLPSELALWLIGSGGRTDLEPAGAAHLQSQGGAVQRPDPAVGRAADLRRLPPGGAGAGLGLSHPARGVPGDPRPAADRGLPGDAHPAAGVSAGPGEGAVGPRPGRRLPGAGVLGAPGRLQREDLDLWARPIGRPMPGRPGVGRPVRCADTVLAGLRDRRRIDHAVAGDRADPRANPRMQVSRRR